MFIAQNDSKHPGRIAVHGTARLLKDARVYATSKNNKVIFNAFVDFDWEYKKEDKNPSRAMGVTCYEPASKRMMAWSKGEIIMVDGLLQKSQYWTQRNGTDTYELVAGFILNQLDYAAAASEKAINDVEEVDDGIDFDIGF